MKDYWTKRLYGRLLSVVTFHRGYTDKTISFKIESITAGYGNPEWGAPITRPVYKIKLGKFLKPFEVEHVTSVRGLNYD